jgi:hypothetical protein
MVYDEDIHKGLTTERAKRVYVRLTKQADLTLEELVQSVKKRKKMGWDQEFAVRVQLERHKLEMHQSVVTTALQVELHEIQMKAMVSMFATSLQDKV